MTEHRNTAVTTSRVTTPRRRRRTAAAAAALAALSATAIVAGTTATAGAAVRDRSPGEAASAAAAGWAPTATKALSLVDATPLGAAPADRPVRLAVTLTPRHRAGIDALLRAQRTPGNPAYRTTLTPAQFTAAFGATAEQAGAVADHLRANGFTDVSVSPNRLSVTATGTAGRAESAFHTTLELFSQHGRTVMANTAPAMVPTALAGTVQSVLGLQDIPVDKLSVHAARPAAAPAAALPSLAGFTPPQLAKIYDVWGLPAAKDTSVGIITEGDMTQTVKDLRTAEKAEHLPQVPVTIRYAGVRSPDTAGTDEWDLDTQTSTGVAGTVKDLYLYTATSLTDADLFRAITLFATRDEARSGSASLGECDALAYASGAALADDVVIAQAAVQGQTFFASSGDTGSFCAVAPTNGVPAGVPDTEYPASGTYTTGVGGTTLLATADGTYQSEAAWDAGGGGLSPVEYPGYWTAGANTLGSAGGLRGVPDVSADADPDTGAIVYVDGSPETIGGTSLSSPLWAGVWARMEQAHHNRLGFAPPLLYGLYDRANAATTVPVAGAGFHDVVLGANGAYTALPGYDYTTGLGTPDMRKLSAALE